MEVAKDQTGRLARVSLGSEIETRNGAPQIYRVWIRSSSQAVVVKHFDQDELQDVESMR